MYLVWFDDSTKKSVQEKIDEAVDRFQDRFGFAPDRCLVNESLVPADSPLLQDPRLNVCGVRYVRPHYFQVGCEDETMAAALRAAKTAPLLPLAPVDVADDGRAVRREAPRASVLAAAANRAARVRPRPAATPAPTAVAPPVEIPAVPIVTVPAAPEKRTRKASTPAVAVVSEDVTTSGGHPAAMQQDACKPDPATVTEVAPAVRREKAKPRQPETAPAPRAKVKPAAAVAAPAAAPQAKVKPVEAVAARPKAKPGVTGTAPAKANPVETPVDAVAVRSKGKPSATHAAAEVAAQPKARAGTAPVPSAAAGEPVTTAPAPARKARAEKAPAPPVAAVAEAPAGSRATKGRKAAPESTAPAVPAAVTPTEPRARKAAAAEAPAPPAAPPRDLPRQTSMFGEEPPVAAGRQARRALEREIAATVDSAAPRRERRKPAEPALRKAS